MRIVKSVLFVLREYVHPRAPHIPTYRYFRTQNIYLLSVLFALELLLTLLGNILAAFADTFRWDIPQRFREIGGFLRARHDARMHKTP